MKIRLKIRSAAIETHLNKEKQKENRRKAILKTARHFFEQNSFESIKIIDIAKECGIAKGTVFNYFKTKEELFLELLYQEYEVWFERMRESLRSIHGKSEQDFCQAYMRFFQETIRENPTFYRLSSILHQVLEKNISPEAAVRFKGLTYGLMMETGKEIDSCLPSLSAGTGATLLLKSHALIVGIHNLCIQPTVIKEAIEELKMDVFNIDFESFFLATLKTLLQGLFLQPFIPPQC